MASAGALNPTHAESLTRCPRCDYSLLGLPTPHACPECGLPYDEDTRIWRPPRRRWQVVAYGTMIPLWLLLSFALTPWLGLLAAYYAWMVYLCLRYPDIDHRCISVGPTGIIVRRAAPRLLTWSEIRPVADWRFPDCIETTVGGELRIGDLLPRFESVYEFCDYVSQRQAQ